MEGCLCHHREKYICAKKSKCTFKQHLLAHNLVCAQSQLQEQYTPQVNMLLYLWAAFVSK